MILKKWIKEFRKAETTPSDGTNNNHSSAGGQRLLVNDRLVPVIPRNNLLPPEVPQRVSAVTCPVHRRSRLKPTLVEVLREQEFLSTFIQYLDEVGGGHLVRFCLEADTFASSYSLETRPNVDADETPSATDVPSNGLDKVKNDAVDPKSTTSDESASRESTAEQNSDSHQSDALAIYRKYLAPESSSIIPVPDEMRNAAIKNICSDSGDIPASCFRPCREKVMEIIEERYFSTFLQSEQFCRYQIDILTNRRACLADFIYNDSAMFCFREFMENEGSVDLLLFVVAVDTYHSLVQDSQCTPEQALEYAMDLYDKYFSLQAHTPLGFDDSIRLEVECSICSGVGPTPDTFEKTRQIVLQFMEKEYLPLYLNSQLFYKYLGELVYTAQTADLACFPRMRPRRLASDSESLSALASPFTTVQTDTSSIHSEPVTARNTLLAGASASAHGRSLRRALDRIGGGDLRITTDAISCLESPWARPSRSGARLNSLGPGDERSAGGSSNGSMTFGHVDEFGQFHSEIERPSTNENGLLSSVFKKSKDKKQAEEEMALEVAKMVIKDVQEMTANAQIQKLAPDDS